ncbi:DUF1127 domain-containing protein [Teichococcus wenyumeiae]
MMATHIVSSPCLVPSYNNLGLRRIWRMVGAMLQAHRTRRLLGEMDARLLADIGTSRAEATTEANRPFWDIR